MDPDENVNEFQSPEAVHDARIVRGWQYAAVAAGIVGIIALGSLWRSSRQVGSMGDQRLALNKRIESVELENERLRRALQQPLEQLEQAKQEISELKTQLKDVTSPQANIPVIEISPQEAGQRSSNVPVQQVRIPRNSKSVILILSSESESDGRNLELEIQDGQRSVIWTQQGVIRHKTSDYTLSIPSDLLSSGNYTLNVYGPSGTKRKKIETYRIKVDKAAT